MESLNSTQPEPHVRQIRKKVHELILHLRDDVERISDPKAKAMFETSAEVLAGLEKTLVDFEQKNEPAWRK